MFSWRKEKNCCRFISLFERWLVWRYAMCVCIYAWSSVGGIYRWVVSVKTIVHTSVSVGSVVILSILCCWARASLVFCSGVSCIFIEWLTSMAMRTLLKGGFHDVYGIFHIIKMTHIMSEQSFIPRSVV